MEDPDSVGLSIIRIGNKEEVRDWRLCKISVA